MSTSNDQTRQAAIAAAERQFSTPDWRPLDDDDQEFFAKTRWARAIVRPWREADDPYGHEYANTYDMACFTIVFRLGCKTRLFLPYIDDRESISWNCAIKHGLRYLEDCPELGLGADLSANRPAS